MSFTSFVSFSQPAPHLGTRFLYAMNLEKLTKLGNSPLPGASGGPSSFLSREWRPVRGPGALVGEVTTDAVLARLWVEALQAAERGSERQRGGPTIAAPDGEHEVAP